MGFVANSDLRRAPDEEGAPTPVGSFGGEFRGPRVTATLVALQSGSWDYGIEIPIRIVPNAWFELPLEDEHLLFWSGVEVTLEIDVLKRALGIPLHKQIPEKDRPYIVASLAPPDAEESALGWYVCARLRGKVRIAREAWNLKIRESIANGRQLRDLPQDPYLNDKGKYAGRLNDPMRLYYERGRNLDNGFLIGRQPAGVPDLVWHFGLCPESCIRAFGLDPDAATVPQTAVRKTENAPSLVRLPRTQPMPVDKAALWHALAGRADGDGDTSLAAMRRRTEEFLQETYG